MKNRASLDRLSGLGGPPERRSAGISPFGTAVERWSRARGRSVPRPRGADRVRAMRARAEAHDLPGEVIDLAWDLVASATLAPEQAETLLFLAIAALDGQRRGSTRIPILGEEGRAHLELLAAQLWASEADRAAAVGGARALAEGADPGGELLGRSIDDHRPLILDHGSLYSERLLKLEDRLARSLAARLARPAAAAAEAEAALAAVLTSPPELEGRALALAPEQVQAVRAALFSPLAVISGGPGTGKTSIVVTVLRALARLGLRSEEIALAAPTGKAANRLLESIQKNLLALPAPDAPDRELIATPPRPQTLHRLLAFRPSTGTFDHHEQNRLSERVVIVDESSMVDLALMERLVQAVRDDARLVLLGDADQLPSVDAGAVLADLARAPAAAAITVTLTQSFRMDASDPAGRAILTTARRINAGESDALFTAPELVRRRSARQVRFLGAELLEAETERPRGDFLERWYAERVLGHPERARLARRFYVFRDATFRDEDLRDLATLFAHLGSHKLLTLTRGHTGDSGADALNQAIHQRVMLDLGLTQTAPFLPGEPVMMLRNDYERGLFNGDQGVILNVAAEGDAAQPMAVFRTQDGFSPFPLGALRQDLVLAHAMTVHKAQGSEHDFVALVLPAFDLPALLTREVLYTALTRAKRSAVIVGHPLLLRRGAERRIERWSGVAPRLAAALEARGGEDASTPTPVGE